MKKLLYFILILCTSSALAQSPNIIDKEKLIEFYQSQRYTEAAAYLQIAYGAETDQPKELAQIAYKPDGRQPGYCGKKLFEITHTATSQPTCFI